MGGEEPELLSDPQMRRECQAAGVQSTANSPAAASQRLTPTWTPAALQRDYHRATKARWAPQHAGLIIPFPDPHPHGSRPPSSMSQAFRLHCPLPDPWSSWMRGRLRPRMEAVTRQPDGGRGSGEPTISAPLLHPTAPRPPPNPTPPSDGPDLPTGPPAPQAAPTTVVPALRQLSMRTSALRGPGSACWLCWLGVPRQRRHGARLLRVLLAIRAQLCALTFLRALTAPVPARHAYRASSRWAAGGDHAALPLHQVRLLTR